MPVEKKKYLPPLLYLVDPVHPPMMFDENETPLKNGYIDGENHPQQYHGHRKKDLQWDAENSPPNYYSETNLAPISLCDSKRMDQALMMELLVVLLPFAASLVITN